MLTQEIIIKAFEERNPFKLKDTDHNMLALSLLRLRIPYEECKSIIGAAGHDIIYLCGIDLICKYLDEQDLGVLCECNVGYSTDTDSLYIFV